MTELMNSSSTESEQMVTSREIAKLTGKQHGHVCRDIEKLNNTYAEIDQSKVGAVEYKDKKGELRKMFNLTESQSLDLAMGYDQTLRIKVRMRWEELERQSGTTLPQTYAQALRAYADEVEHNELNQVKITSLEESLDESEQWISILRVAQERGVKENVINWRVLKAYSIDNGIEIKKVPCPRFKTKNLYHVSVFSKCYPSIRVIKE